VHDFAWSNEGLVFTIKIWLSNANEFERLLERGMSVDIQRNGRDASITQSVMSTLAASPHEDSLIQFLFLLLALFCAVRAIMRFGRARDLRRTGSDRAAFMARIGALIFVAAAILFALFALVVMPSVFD
jgi:hypothetical protein